MDSKKNVVIHPRITVSQMGYLKSVSEKNGGSSIAAVIRSLISEDMRKNNGK